MVIIQEEYPLRKGCATTSDWLGQVKGGVIYAYDLGDLIPGEIVFADMPENQDKVQKTVQKYKARFKDAWEELSDR